MLGEDSGQRLELNPRVHEEVLALELVELVIQDLCDMA